MNQFVQAAANGAVVGRAEMLAGAGIGGEHLRNADAPKFYPQALPEAMQRAVGTFSQGRVRLTLAEIQSLQKSLPSLEAAATIAIVALERCMELAQRIQGDVGAIG